MGQGTPTNSTTQHASAGGVVEALLEAARRPVADRRRHVDAALRRLTAVPGIVGAHLLDDGDDQDRACLDDLVPALGSLVSTRRFVRPRHDLTPASADRLRTPGASIFAGFTDVAFDLRWGALVVGLDDQGVRRVSQFDRLHQVGSVAGWIARSVRLSSIGPATDEPSPSTTTSEDVDPWVGAIVDLVPHGVVFHLVPGAPHVRNRRSRLLESDFQADTGSTITTWDETRFLRANGSPDGRTAPEIIRIGGLPTWWRRTSVVHAEGGAVLGMLTEFGPLDGAGGKVVVADAPDSETTIDRARAAIAAALPTLDDDEQGVVDQVLLGRRMSTAARELHLGERRVREALRSVLARLDPLRQAELSVLVRRTTTVG